MRQGTVLLKEYDEVKHYSQYNTEGLELVCPFCGQSVDIDKHEKNLSTYTCPACRRLITDNNFATIDKSKKDVFLNNSSFAPTKLPRKGMIYWGQ